MEDLKEQASKYVEEKMFDILKEAFAKVYADGYRSGYKDRDAEISVDLRDNKTEYIDLGLPSGTLWAKEFEQNGDNVHYLPYCDASTLSLPTEDQWNELLTICRWEYTCVNTYSRKYDCIGPNGKVITFNSYGFYKVDGRREQIARIFFWLKDPSEEPDKKLVYMYYDGKDIKSITKSFMGFKYPVRLVQIKKEK